MNLINRIKELISLLISLLVALVIVGILGGGIYCMIADEAAKKGGHSAYLAVIFAGFLFSGIVIGWTVGIPVKIVVLAIVAAVAMFFIGTFVSGGGTFMEFAVPAHYVLILVLMLGYAYTGKHRHEHVRPQKVSDTLVSPSYPGHK
jgi:peptidoglycan/LPS O-acetylase OafA/YrhL